MVMHLAGGCRGGRMPAWQPRPPSDILAVFRRAGSHDIRPLQCAGIQDRQQHRISLRQHPDGPAAVLSSVLKTLVARKVNTEVGAIAEQDDGMRECVRTCSGAVLCWCCQDAPAAAAASLTAPARQSNLHMQDSKVCAACAAATSGLVARDSFQKPNSVAGPIAEQSAMPQTRAHL